MLETHIKSSVDFLQFHICKPQSVYLEVTAVNHQSSLLQGKLRHKPLAIGIMSWCRYIFSVIRINCSREKDASMMKISEEETAKVYMRMSYVKCSAEHLQIITVL